MPERRWINGDRDEAADVMVKRVYRATEGGDLQH